MNSSKFVSQAIQPVGEEKFPIATAIGEPALPLKFAWRDKEIEIVAVLERWKEMRGDTHKSREQYVFKHWFKVETSDGRNMKIYFERRPRSKQEAKRRWWLFSIEDTTTPPVNQ